MLKRIISNFCCYWKTVDLLVVKGLAPGLLCSGLLLSGLLLSQTAYAQQSPQKPAVFLLKTYDGSQDVVGWMMSEKLDGIRGIWDGKRLMSRAGGILHAPQWFVADFPPFALDGELWTRRADFENISSIVRRKKPDDRWRQISYHVFEVPHQAGGLLDRLTVLGDYLQQHPNPYLKIIPQTKIHSKSQLQRLLTKISGAGGEGVVVRNPDTPYQTGRLSSALKLKKYRDAECVVREILPGKGKYSGKMGSIACQMTDQMLAGTMLKIGSGFSDAQRADPPPVGSTITFKYYGLTKNDKPRFPVFLRRFLPIRE